MVRCSACQPTPTDKAVRAMCISMPTRASTYTLNLFRGKKAILECKTIVFFKKSSLVTYLQILQNSGATPRIRVSKRIFAFAQILDTVA
jgi:hypothetical protein